MDGATSGGPLVEQAASWLSVAVLLHRCADETGDGTAVRNALAGALGRAARAERGDSLGAAARAQANDAEEAGAFHLACSILGALERLSHDDPIERGRAIAQRARIARKVNDHENSLELYRTVEAIARRARNDELHARAYVGYGVLAHTRGNLPEARRCFAQAAATADHAAVAEVSTLAHHGLMIIAAKTGELDRSLHEGWLAFHHAGEDGERQGNMLVCLGQLLLEMQHPRPALHAFASAILQTALPRRLLLPACGGLAVAAAAVGDARLVEYADNRIETIAREVLLPYEVVSAQLDLAHANFQLGRHASGERHRQRALHGAAEHEFHELAHRAETLRVQTPTTREPREPLGERGREVVERLERLGRPEALYAHA